LLTTGESVVLRERQHWLALILDSRLAALFWGATIILGLFRILVDPDGRLDVIVTPLFLISLLAGVVIVAFRWWKWQTTEYLVTSRRLLNVTGIINKRSADSSLEKINDAILEVNLVGRLLDYGDLKILTAAETGIDRYRMLHHATAFKKAMLTAKHALELGDGEGLRPTATGLAPAAAPTGAAPNAPVDMRADTPEEVTALLTKLGRLREEGTITPEDYEAKKRELLDRL
jgi:hypothetical protein